MRVNQIESINQMFANKIINQYYKYISSIKYYISIEKPYQIHHPEYQIILCESESERKVIYFEMVNAENRESFN